MSSTRSKFSNATIVTCMNQLRLDAELGRRRERGELLAGIRDLAGDYDDSRIALARHLQDRRRLCRAAHRTIRCWSTCRPSCGPRSPDRCASPAVRPARYALTTALSESRPSHGRAPDLYPDPRKAGNATMQAPAVSSGLPLHGRGPTDPDRIGIGIGLFPGWAIARTSPNPIITACDLANDSDRPEVEDGLDGEAAVGLQRFLPWQEDCIAEQR